MLVLKLTLVPLFILLISLAGRAWGPSVAGLLAGLPVVGGPILFFIAFENDQLFAAAASSASLSAVGASIIFNVSYAHAASYWRWQTALSISLSVWLVVAMALAQLPREVLYSGFVALICLVLAPRMFPTIGEIQDVNTSGRVELLLRMLVSAALVIVVTMLAQKLGSSWSGLLAVFPVPGIILAMFSHRKYGADYTKVLLKAFCSGLYAFASFTFVLTLTLPVMSIGSAFALAVLCSITVQVVTKVTLSRNAPVKT
ncbi:hypothetical protein [Enterovibrio norvegicus]|uniref:hypothetical protein n=1 Tax=Enterovibrio norvegicus TaxID=188144 RepID=UPI0013D6F336|nr:hypothetical protein [Enterovibrio norvegicus]